MSLKRAIGAVIAIKKGHLATVCQSKGNKKPLHVMMEDEPEKDKYQLFRWQRGQNLPRGNSPTGYENFPQRRTF